MLETKTTVETRISRPLVDCWDVRPGIGVVRIEALDVGQMNVWVPDVETCVALALELLQYYRGDETFEPSKRTVWPYVEPYSSIDLIFGNACAKSEHIYRESLLNDATVYDYAARALVFSDGVQAQDPFIVLLTEAVDRARLTAPWHANNDGFQRQVEQQLRNVYREPSDLGAGLRNVDGLWAAALHQYLRVREVYEAGYVRFVPGRLRLDAIFRQTPEDSIKAVRAKLDAVMRQHSVEVADTPECFAYLRAYQTMLEAGTYRGGSPLFLDMAQWDAAMALFKAGALELGAVNRQRLAQAALHSNVSIEPPSQSELVLLRRDEELFGKWREIRNDVAQEIETLSLMGEPSALQIAELLEINQRKWEARLEDERRRGGSLAQKFDLRTNIVWGLVVGAATAAATVMAGGAPLGAIVVGAGAGASGVMGVPLYNYLRENIKEQKRADALQVFGKHMMCLGSRRSS